MRSRAAGLVAVILVFSAVAFAAGVPNSSSAASSQALSTLQSAITALGGASSVNDVTLTGTAQYISGSDNETGSATYKALSAANRLDLSLSNGARSEARSLGATTPTGSWSGPDGISHPFAYHNLLVDPGLFPLFPLSALNSSSSTILTYVGVETRNGSSVVHLKAAQLPPTFAAAADSALFQHLTGVDVFLDPTTFLPVSYVFNIHPDENELFDIPVEIRYSNYQALNGLQVPLRVQRYLNNSLVLDLQFQSATFNTGLSLASLGL